MSYLARESALISAGLWSQIDAAVVASARNVMVGRKFLHIFGPLGIGADHIAVDAACGISEVAEDGFMTVQGRTQVAIPTLFADFTLFAKDLETSEKSGFPADLSKVISAAEECALKEDKFIFFGNPKFGYEGLLTAAGVNQISKKDWAKGENAYSDLVSGLGTLAEKGIYGEYSLVVSPDLYMQLQRIQPGTGLLEIDRIGKLFNSRVFKTPVFGKGKAVLVCADPRNMDLVVGQDMMTAFLEQKDLNHCFRVLETVLLRVKRAEAIVVFG
jgi:uncharacterized linocin/CFP29 family protein